MADYKYKPSIVIDDLLSGLKNLKQEATAADKVISMIGNRGNLNKLLATFLRMDDMIEGLVAGSDKLKANLGERLQGGYLKNIDEEFGKLSELLKKTQSFAENVLNVDLRKAGAKGQIKDLANQINAELASIGSTNQIDFKLFNEASIKEQRDLLIGYINQIGSEITMSIGKIDASNLGENIVGGLNDAGKNIKDSGKKFSAEVQAQIDEIEEKNKKLNTTINKLKKTQQLFKDIQSGKASIPKGNVVSGEQLEGSNAISTVKTLIAEYDKLDEKIAKGDQSSIEYYNDLIKLSEVALKLKSIMSQAKSGTDLKNILLADGSYNELTKYGGTKFSGLAGNNSKLMIANQNNQLNRIIDSNIDKIEEIKVKASNDISNGFSDGANKSVSSIKEIEKELHKLDELIADRNSFHGLNSSKYKEYDKKVQNKLKDFKNQYGFSDDQINDLNDTLGIDDETTQEVIDNLLKVVNVGNNADSSMKQTGEYAVTATEYVNNLALALQNLFDVGSRKSQLEYKVLINGNEIDMRPGTNKSIPSSTYVESYLSNLDANTIVDAHTHQGLIANIGTDDFSNAVKRFKSGLVPLSAIVGDNYITTIDLTKVKLKDLATAIERVNDATEKSKTKAISSKKFNKIMSEINPAYSDVAKQWDPSQFKNLAQYIVDVGQSADMSLTPLEKFEALLSTFNVDTSKYENLLKNFSKDNAQEIFNQIAKQEGIMDENGILVQATNKKKGSIDVAKKNLEEQIDSYRKLREEANLTYSDVKKGIQQLFTNNDESFLQKFYHPDEHNQFRDFIIDIEDGILTVDQLAKKMASDFGIDISEIKSIADETGNIGEEAQEVATKMKAFSELADEISHKTMTGDMNDIEIGQYTERLEIARRELQALGDQGLITANDLEAMNKALDVAQNDLKNQQALNESSKLEGYVHEDNLRSIEKENDELREKQRLLEQNNDALEEQLSQERVISDELGQRALDAEWDRDKEKSRAEELVEENTELKEKLDLISQIKAVEKQETYDDDELEDIQKENGALEDKLERLQDIANMYGSNITQRNRDRYEELNQKDMDSGLTDKESDRFWELGETISEADENLESFGATYDSVVLKLANGKKIKIFPDDAGLRKLAKIADENSGEYNGIDIADVQFERIKNPLENEIPAAANKTEQELKDVGQAISDIVYHAGDLSNISKTLKSFPLGNISPHKADSNVFGGLTGLYTTEDLNEFMGNEWSGAPLSSIDLSQYKMFDAKSDDLAAKVNNFFSDLNGTIYGYLDYFDYDNTFDMARTTDVKTVEQLYDEFKEVFKDIELDFETFSNFVQQAKSIVAGYDFASVNPIDIDKEIGKSSVSSALQGVSKEVFNSDSFATQLMKMIGFEGIDLRGTKYKGTYSGGTVIFDIKPESLQAVNEKWSDVMASNGYEVDESTLRYEEKRRQLAFDTAKAYSMASDEANKQSALFETSSGQMAMFDNMADGAQKASAATEELVNNVKQLDGQTSLFDEDYAKNIQDVKQAQDNLDTSNEDDSIITKKEVDGMHDLESATEAAAEAQEHLNKAQKENVNLRTDSTPNGKSSIVDAGGGYALESTLQQTNAILNSIDGKVSKETSKKTSPIKDFNLNDINTSVLNAASGLSSDLKIGGFETLKDGMRQVTGAFKNADGVWEGFTAQVNEANQVIKISTKTQSAFADALNKVNTQTKEASNNTKISVPSIKAQEDKYAVRLNDAKGYLDQNAGFFSSKVTDQVKLYETALKDLKTAQQAFNNVGNLSADELRKLQDDFAIAKNKCEDYGKGLEKLIKANEKFRASNEKIKDISSNDYDDAESALKDYVNEMYGAEAKVEDFDSSLEQLNFTFKDSSGAIRNMTASFDATGTAIGAAANKAKKSTSVFQSIITDLGSKSKELMMYFTARFGIDELIQQVRNGIQYVRDIDLALTELKKVTSETDATYEKFLQTASKTAGVIGSTVSELTTMTADWARLGYSIEDSAKLAESTAILLNVSEFTDATEASEALISTMQGFGYVAEDSQHVVDILNEVGNNFAVSSDGLAVALQHSASALAEGGNNLEQSVALIAAANKVVQDPNSVGNALKTISLRLRGTSLQVLEEMGEETDGMVEGISKMQEKIKAASGVDILTETGAYKDTYTILYEIGQVWEDMSDVNQAALLELLAGKHRANTLAAILDNMTDLKGAYETAMDAEGSALRENEAYLNSIQGRIDLFTNALQTFWMNLLDSDMVKGVVDSGTVLIKFLDTIPGKVTAIVGAFMLYKKIKDKVKFADMFKGVGNLFQEVYSVIMQMVSATKTLSGATLESTLASKLNSAALAQELMAKAGLTGVTGKLTAAQIKEMTAKLNTARANGTLTTSQYLAAMSTMGLKTALQGLWTVLKAHPIFLVAAAVTALALAFDHFNITAQEAADAARDAFDEIQKVVEETESTIQSLESELSTLQDKIDELDGKKLSFAEDQELEKLKQQRTELEHSLKIQEQLLKLQRESSNKQAIASMKAYTKAASEGAKETQKTATTLGTIAGVVGGAILTIGGLALIPVSGGTSSALSAMGASAIATSVGIGAAAVGIAGNKAGEAIGSSISENEGTYDSWYETYTKALETARKEEQKALKEYQKDSSDIDKLDKWQEAQQKTSDIEQEMYEHLTQMQQYYNDLEYGTSEEIDRELNTWNNFLDKFSIDQGASDAEVTALDRIFGENASKETKKIKNQILEAIAAGEDFDFDTAIDGSQELNSVLDYIGLSAEDVKNYFTQIGEAAVVASTGPEINPIDTYSNAKASIESYNDILSQTSEILGDNTQVTQEYKDAIINLVGSEEAVNKCFDTNNGLIVTNAKGLKDLVTQSIKLEKAQSQLDYYNLVKQLDATLDGTKKLDAATKDSMHTLLNQIDTVESAIYQYQLLEDSLLGAVNAFDEFSKAQEIDAMNTYGDSYVEMAQTMYDALYKTNQVGTEAFNAAAEALIDPSVYAGLEGSARISAIEKAFKNTVLPTITLDSESLSIDYGDIESFVKKALSSGVFTGNIKAFDLVEGMNLEKAAELLNMTETQTYSFFAELDKYNTTGDSFLPKLDDSIEGRILRITDDIEDLNRKKLALLEDGGYEKHKTEIDSINKELAKCNSNMQIVGEEAYQMWSQYAKNDTALNALDSIEDKQQKITEQAAKAIGLKWDDVKGKTIQQVYDDLLVKQKKLGIPTELTVQFAKDNVDVALEDLEGKLKEKKIDVEANIIWNEESEKYETAANSKYAGDKDLKEYVNLLNDQYALEQYLEQGLTSTETYLSSIENILKSIYDVAAGKDSEDKDISGDDIKTGSTESKSNEKTSGESNFVEKLFADINNFGNDIADIFKSINFEDIKNWGSNVADSIGEFFTTTFPETWDKFWQMIGEGFEQINNWCSNLIQPVVEFFTVTIPQKWNEFWDGVGEALIAAYNIGADLAQKVQEFFTVTIPEKWDAFWTSVGTTFGEIATWGSNLFEKVSEFFTVTLPERWNAFWDEVDSFLFETIPFAVGFVGGKIYSFFTDTLPEKWEEFWNKIEETISSIQEYVEDLKESVIEFFTETIPEKWEEFWKAAEEIFADISSWGKELFDDVKKFFTQTIPQKWREFWNEVSNVISSIREFATSLKNSVVDFFTVTIPQKWNEFWTKVGAVISDVKEYTNLLWGKVVEFFTVTIPTKWNEFWTNVGLYISENIIPALELVKQKVIEFFTVTIPEKWNNFIDSIVDFITVAIPTGLQAIGQKITEVFTITIPGIINGMWSGLVGWISEKAASIWSNLTSGFTEGAGGKGGSNGVNGTAHIHGIANAKGTARKSGDWGAPRTETALVGELGREIVVRGNRWFTVGDNGAEFTDIKKDDIIFNHKQTEALLSRGYITGRGKAYASGTAYRQVEGSYDLSASISKKKKTTNKKTAAEEVADAIVEKVATKVKPKKTESKTPTLTQKSYIPDGGLYNGGSSSNSNNSSKGSGSSSGSGGSSSNNSDSSSKDSTKDETEQLIDFIEIKLEEIEEIISNTSAKLENVLDNASAKSVQEKDSLYDTLVQAEKDKAKTYLDAAEEYNKRANEALKEVPTEYHEMAKNGAIAIKDFVGEDQAEIADAINEYREWSNKAADAENGHLEAVAQQSAYRLQQLEDISDDFENLIGLITVKSDLLQSEMDLVEESGKRLDESYYKELINSSNSQMLKLEEQKKEMQKILNDSVKKGEIEIGSNDWYAAVEQIVAVDEEIIQCKIDMEEFNNSMNDLHWDNLDKLINRFDALDSELSHLYDRFTDSDKVVDDKGAWTNEGIAAIGVLAQQMELAQTEVQKYNEEISYLNKNWKQLGYSEDAYNEKLAELKDNQWESIEAYEDAKDAIVDLNKTRIDTIKDGMEKEIDAYKELIDKKKEALDADKDLYDFEKNVKEQQKEISDIERKLASLEGNNTMSAMAQKAKLQAELAEAKSNLDDTYYERSVNQAKEALDNSYETYEERMNNEMELLDKSLENEEKIIYDSMQTAKQNEDTVLKEMNEIAKKYGIEISSSITKPWQDGSNAISSYQTSFKTLTDSFAEELNKIIAQEEALQKQAEKTAQAVINSVNTRLDKVTEQEKEEPKKDDDKGNKNDGNKQPESKDVIKGQTVVVKKTATHFSSKSRNLKMASFVPGSTYTVMQVSGDEILIGQKGVATGWVKKSDLEGYAKGTTKVKNDQFAWIDEVGEELVLHAGADGKLSYLTKGSSVIPSDLTEKLLKLAVDPTQTLEYSRPVINAPHITNNEINIDMSIAEVVHIDTVTNDTMPDLTKAVEKQMNKYIKSLNGQIRKYAR